MQSIKRKSQPWTTAGTSSTPASPAPGRSSGSNAPSWGAAKVEPNDPDIKRAKYDLSTSRGSHGMYNDYRTAANELYYHLKKTMTLARLDAYYRVQEASPDLDPEEVLEQLKKLERVTYNEINEVFEYKPELTLTTEPQLRTYIRTNSTSSAGIPLKVLREAMPTCTPILESLEERGEILIMRGLAQGLFKDLPLPKLGRKNVNGLGVMEGGASRWKNVFWDEVKERGRGGKRVDDEFVFMWADVPIAETDDVMKLLAEQDLGASSAVPLAPKVAPSGPLKKKRKTTRALKITNTHMKEQGIDFSKDYERPA